MDYAFIEHFQEIAPAHSPCAGWNGAMAKTRCEWLIEGFSASAQRLDGRSVARPPPANA